jgi:hypothetical protein
MASSAEEIAQTVARPEINEGYSISAPCWAGQWMSEGLSQLSSVLSLLSSACVDRSIGERWVRVGVVHAQISSVN